MMNIIRADVYRITRGWGWWVTFLVVALIPVGIIAASMLTGQGPMYEGADIPFSGVSALTAMGYLGVFLAFFAAPVFSIVSSPIFQDKTEKNEVTWGVSRTVLYVSRLVVAALWCLLIMLIWLGVPFLIGLVYGGLGEAEAGFWLNMFASYSAQWFLMTATVWLGVFVTFVVKNAFVSFEIWGGIVGLPTALAMSFAMATESDIITRIMYFDITTSMVYFADLAALDNRRIAIGLAVGAFWAFVPAIIGLIRYQRKEIS